ncbi:MAG: translation initiation factor [Proteobacteria bacterium]|nr:MAG: translation initiation factor [Pseudomonadota bacterium]
MAAPDDDNPFAALASLRDALPAGKAPPPPPGPPSAAAAKVPARAVVRREKKGRRGKTVTLVQQLGLDQARMKRWLRDLKKALGCGGKVEGDQLMLQGDRRAAVADWLRARGVRKVSVSG